MSTSSIHRIAGAALLLTVAACADPVAGPDDLAHRPSGASVGTEMTLAELESQAELAFWFRRAWVCKVGSSATFEVSVDGGTPVEHTIADGQCKEVHYNAGGPDEYDVVTVTELSSLNAQLDSIVKDSIHGDFKVRFPKITGTATASITTYRSKGGLLIYYNSDAPPPPSGGQGCTPGYWKQSQHFDSWTAPYTPNTLFSSVFDDAFPGKTLLQVLSAGGGGLTALGRHTVAALLSSAHAGVNYGVSTPAEVIGAFNAAYPGSDYTTLKDRFERFNEAGCPLN